MTLKQKQALLAYLGYYDGVIDGQWGSLSTAACRAFQADYGLAADGICGQMTQKMLIGAISGMAVKVERPSESEAEAWDKPQTGTFWDEIRYFNRDEFRCPCPRCGGFPVEPSETLVRLADRVREHFGAPANVSSGVRCQAHNDELPGSAKNSYHLRGKAMDFAVSGVSGAKLLAYVKTQQVHYAYQISGSDYVHMDVE